MTMSPDGVALLFDQVLTEPSQNQSDLLTKSGQAVIDGRLWLLPLPESLTPQDLLKLKAEALNSGFKPKWLP